MKYAELIMVTPDNNNKFIRMKDMENGTFVSEWGRVGQAANLTTYPISKWNSYYNSKVKKGYKDVSAFKAEDIKSEFIFEDPSVQNFYSIFSRYTNHNVNKNYIIDSSAVTKAMLSEAQSIVDELMRSIPNFDKDTFNKYLVDLFTVLPRRMSDVRTYLTRDDFKEEKLRSIVAKEQDVLDSLSSKIAVTINSDENVSFEEFLGIKIKEETDSKILETLKNLVEPTNSSRHKIFKVFSIDNKPRTEEFNAWVKDQKDKRTEYLIHGTRNPNVFSILKSGLLIRPSNAAAISGAAYGEGIYHSAHTDKSLGYTGYDPDKLFFIQNVHMGKPYEYNGWYRGNDFPLRYDELKKRNFDSVYVKPGNGLRNSEYIVYNKNQSNTNFLIWLK